MPAPGPRRAAGPARLVLLAQVCGAALAGGIAWWLGAARAIVAMFALLTPVLAHGAVLAAGTGREGPGPLVSALAGKSSASFPIPVAIVPGHLEDEEIDALA